MPKLQEYDRSAQAKEIFREATRAGITAESVGEWLNLALRSRYGTRPDPESEADCIRRALYIHNTFGSRHAVYALPTGFKGCAYDVVSARLEELESLQGCKSS